ncbi:dipeptide/oligopeptide/nickel ABC transporter permease/ATP-binding protein [Canibacter zhoujuaniae]|uniref:dipeptide/oligopeptide/nickel ABC transporter permease/ATP-binding protein n=1 Tax=Canibacter zhoujuaniae TaxID=2708343 RepID=UPI0014232380|nr:dipeptide/oligopeptide/nickel ABC transporter permease/ATP-binding protein [Canibacter zhoujuaniae]
MLSLYRINKFAPLALAVVALTALAALLSLFWTPYPPNFANPDNLWAGPSAAHPLGNDGSGRDLLSGLLAGAQVTVVVALCTAAGSALLSLLLAGLTVRGPRITRQLSSVIIDVLIAFPTLLLAMMLAATFKNSVIIVVAALIFGFGFSLSRVIRGELAQAYSSDFVTAARFSGVGEWRIFWRHCVLPATPVLITKTALAMGLAVLAESSLSYLGFGVPQSTPSWGRMLAQTQQAASVYPLAAAVPGVALTAFALSCFVLGDALRQLADPRLRRRSRSRVTPVSLAQQAVIHPQQTAATKPLLTVQDLTITDSDGAELLHKISFTVHQGERIGIIGRSGSGKTLTAQAIAQLLPTALTPSGSIDYAGEAILGLTEEAAANLRGAEISYVFQEPKTALNPLQQLWKQMTAALNHHFQLSRAARREQAQILAERVGLEPELLTRYPHQVSGGQRQRAAIAAALSANPKLVIADEVTSALDHDMRQQILRLLGELTGTNERALIFISHDLTQVRDLVDRVLVIDHGYLVEDGSVAEIFANPKHATTKALLGASTREERV